MASIYERHEHLIGKKFNKLTVVDIDLNKSVKKRLICKCDCGNISKSHLRELKSGRKKSCGCLKHDNINTYHEMVGKKINKWTILEFVYDINCPMFKCRCECGTIKNVNVYNMLRNISKDCGCGRKQNLSKAKSKDYVGMRFGRLVVVEKLPNSNKFKRLQYRCKCDCGNEIIVPSQSLVTQHTSSCGCLVSYYNMLINQYLDEKRIPHKAEYTIYVDNKYYRFDFYLPTYNLMIEYDGEQHFKPVKHFKCSEAEALKKLESVQQSDKMKDKYCLDNGIELLRIPYWEKKNVKAIIDTCLQRLSEKGVA